MQYIDDESFPIVWVRFPATASVEVIRSLFAELEQVLDKHQAQCGMIVDLTLTNPLSASAKERKALADEGLRLRPKFERLVLAEARVIKARAMRALVTAVDWMEGAWPWQRTTVATLAESVDWLSRTLPAGTVTDEMRALLARKSA